MQRSSWIWTGLVVLVILYGCNDSPNRPKPGDTITPVLGQKLTWTAGNPVELAVRLQAQGESGAARPLGFSGINRNPVARVAFYEEDTELGSQQVTLSHRC